MFKLAIKRHFKKQVKSTWLYDNFSKNKKKLICFDPVAAVSFIVMGQRMYTFIRNFLEDSLSSSSISSEIVQIEKLDYFHEGVYSLSNGCHGNRIKAISQLTQQLLLQIKKLLQNLNLIDSNYHCKNWVDWIIVALQCEIACHNLRKKHSNLKKLKTQQFYIS